MASSIVVHGDPTLFSPRSSDGRLRTDTSGGCVIRAIIIRVVVPDPREKTYILIEVVTGGGGVTPATVARAAVLDPGE
ncbi:hypothetical protein ZIOFF_027350 [Zingiber officinale]|uniref:Uncharacterized protein n=1 Tax=Zingiber officinale TaxID=94328 RepID=A0A8J5GSK0_ZINOF|nr:hypothetical protein ZIOFF_027350 [Zingiber officinale]